MKPTDEQAAAVAMFGKRTNLAIEAGAGTGKTSTLKLLAEAAPDRRGSYVAFNKAIVVEAQAKMPSNVTSSTAHSLAYRGVGNRFRHRLNSGRIRSDQIARRLGVDPHVVTYGTDRKVLQPGYLGSLVMQGIVRFCQSADDELTRYHLPYIDGIDPPTDSGARTYSNNDQVRSSLEPALAKAWADLCNTDGSLPYRHDHYLKFWQLNDPKIPGDFVLFDEAQDAAPVMLAAVEAQEGSQLVFVGDSQQAIYEWRGAVNALANVPCEQRSMLTQSFRFGPAIADVANLILDELDADLRLVGFDQIDSELAALSTADCVLTRTNAAAVSTVLDFQLRGITVHLIGGGAEVVSFAKAAAKLMLREPVFHPELACFVSWAEVQEYVQNDPAGGELRLMVSLVDQYGVDVILRALDRMPPEQNAQAVVSTAHKAKGREWNRVKLAADFTEPSEEAVGEWRLLYVAATRAKHVLDLTACDPLAKLVGLVPPQLAVVVEP